MAADYRPINNQLGPVLNGQALQRYMTSIAADAASVAKRYAARPGDIRATAELTRGRWRAVVLNASPGALAEEYGTKHLKPTRPLGLTLDAIAAKDPNRKRGARTRR